MSPVAPSRPAELNAALQTLVPAWSVSDVAVIEALPGGYSHLNLRLRYDGQDYVLRLPAADPDAGAALFEMNWLAGLPEGLGAPIVAFNQSDGTMLSRWIEAPLLAGLPSPPDQLVRYLVTLHRRLPATTRAFDLPQRVDAWLGASAQPAAVSRARKRLSMDESSLQSCHNDLNPWNILCESNGWRTLDWEWVGRNDPLFDLAGLGLGAGCTLGELTDMARAYLDGMAIAVDDSTLRNRLNRAVSGFWLREYAWAFSAIRGGNDRQEVSEQLHTALEWLQRR